MVKPKRNITEVDTYESDGGFVSNDDSKAPKSKKTKKAQTGSRSEGAKFWSLSSGRQPRRVEIAEFKNNKLISIREFYEKDDEYLPGKKGISLTVDQYKALLKAIPEINASLKQQGIDVGRSAADDDDEEEAELETVPKKRVRTKTEKANIDATSDEEED